LTLGLYGLKDQNNSMNGTQCYEKVSSGEGSSSRQSHEGLLGGSEQSLDAEALYLHADRAWKIRWRTVAIAIIAQLLILAIYTVVLLKFVQDGVTRCPNDVIFCKLETSN
jgi:hypothetical protein